MKRGHAGKRLESPAHNDNKLGFNVMLSGYKGKSALELIGIKSSKNVLLGHKGKNALEMAAL